MNSEFSHRIFSICLLVLLFGAGPLRAEQPEPEAAATAGNIVFTCVQWDPLPIAPLFYRNGKAPAPLVLRTMRRSLPYKLGPEARFDLLTVETLPDGSTRHKLVGSTPIPQGASRLMFLIEPKPQRNADELPLEVVAVEDSLKNFPPGSFRFANATARNLRIEFGGVAVSPAPGATALIKPQAQEAGFYPIQIFDSSGKIIFQTRFFWEPMVREYVILKTAAGVGEGKLALRFVSEVVEPQRPAGAPATFAR